MAASTRAEPPGVATAFRGFTSAGVFLSADVHLVLWVEGYRDIPVVGQMFLVNAVAGFVLGLLVLLWRDWRPLFLAFGFSAATLMAFYLSTTVGFFGVQETIAGTRQVTAAAAEWVALLGSALAMRLELRRAAPPGGPTAHREEEFDAGDFDPRGGI